MLSMLSRASIQAKNQNICTILRLIEKNKSVLFGQYNIQIHVRTAKWQEIYDQAVKLEIAPPHKNWKYVRDILWQRWKTKALGKVSFFDAEQSKVNLTNSPLNKCDQLVLNILGLKIVPIVNEMQTIKVEVNSEPEDQGFEVLSDEDVTLQSPSLSKSLLKMPNIKFIPVQKSIENNPRNGSNSKRKISENEDVSPSGSKSDETKINISKQSRPSSPKNLELENSAKGEQTTDESNIQFPSDIKNIHKMILDNVRDIKMKLLIPKKPTMIHCETCCNTSKEILSVQNQMLDVQKQNLQIQLQILEELKKKNSCDTITKTNNDTEKNNDDKDRSSVSTMSQSTASDDGSNSSRPKRRSRRNLS